MTQKMYLRTCFFVTFFIGALLAHGTAFSSSDRIFSDVGFSQSTDGTAINVQFNFPVKYLRHYPLNNGTEVRIQFEPILISAQDAIDLDKREIVYPPKGNPAGVVRVEYDGEGLQQPSVLVLFDRSRYFDAGQGNDFRSLIIRLQTENMPAAGEASATAAPEATEKSGATDALPSSKGPSIQRRAPGVLTKDREKELLAEGVSAMTEKNYTRAVQVYTRLLDSKDPEVLETAQFQLALAQELVGHLAHARAEYKNYMKQFPDGDNTKEAQRRLANLLRDRLAPAGGETAYSEAGKHPWEKDFYGSVSLYYDRDESVYPDETDEEKDEIVTNIDSMTTGVDATLLLRSNHYAIEGVVIGSVENDFVADRSDETRIAALYFDFEDVDKTIEVRLGRQRTSSGGVLGRFDGARLGYGFMDTARLNLVAGYPVDRSSDGFESDRYFYGVNLDLGPFGGRWNFTPYLIDQRNDDIKDRQAIGTEVRYLGDRGSFFTLADYDLLYSELGLFLFAGNYLLPDNQTRVNLSIDLRKSPFLTTGNALIGQDVPTLGALVDLLGEATVRELARDRSLSSSLITVGATWPLTDSIQIAADVSWSKIGGMPASGGVDGFDSTGDEYYGSIQLIGESFFTPNDLSTLSLRYARTRQRHTATLFASTRYPLSTRWRLTPKLQIDHRKNRLLSGDQWRFRPGVRLEYILSRKWYFEIDGEYSYADKALEGLATEREGYAVSLGARFSY